MENATSDIMMKQNAITIKGRFGENLIEGQDQTIRFVDFSEWTTLLSISLENGKTMSVS